MPPTLRTTTVAAGRAIGVHPRPPWFQPVAHEGGIHRWTQMEVRSKWRLGWTIPVPIPIPIFCVLASLREPLPSRLRPIPASSPETSYLPAACAPAPRPCLARQATMVVPNATEVV